VPVQVLCRALHRQIDPQRQRLLVDRAGERLSTTDMTPAGPARLRHAPDVHASQRRVDGRLEPDQARAIAEHALRCARSSIEMKQGRDAKACEQVVEQVQRAAVDPAPPSTSSPALRCAIRIVVVAPCPDENRSAASARSDCRDFRSTLTTVGFV